MNKKYYSASTGGFYASEIHGDNIPKDAKEITQEKHKEILQSQSTGKQIIADKNGYPIAIDPVIVPIQIDRITRSQGKKQLIIAGLYDQIKASIDASESELARIGFYDEVYWLINDEFVQMAKDVLKLSDSQLQDLFNEAAKL